MPCAGSQCPTGGETEAQRRQAIRGRCRRLWRQSLQEAPGRKSCLSPDRPEPSGDKGVETVSQAEGTASAKMGVQGQQRGQHGGNMRLWGWIMPGLQSTVRHGEDLQIPGGPQSWGLERGA